MDRATTGAVALRVLVLAGAFQSQAHQDGLEEQANCALAVVVKAESILVLDELADVARENCGEEGSCAASPELLVTA